MAAELRDLISRRGVMKRQIIAFQKFFDNGNFSDSSTVMELGMRTTRLEAVYGDFLNSQTRIEILDPREEQLEERLAIETAYYETISPAMGSRVSKDKAFGDPRALRRRSPGLHAGYDAILYKTAGPAFYDKTGTRPRALSNHKPKLNTPILCLEHLIVEVKLNHKSKICLVVCYIPPSTPLSSYISLINSLEWLQSTLPINHKILLMGSFNFPLVLFLSDNNGFHINGATSECSDALFVFSLRMNF
ncbi:hypothetical protein AGLY_003495 [Aphis glycines]|uniref:Endonuclease/exonuclease/phosphatase domain-containing protein n=1 Tax=Aphis glycines TaxID=307491 RepID=A0A6G0TZS9_APHGL|nr:hypothetical protein AGLY_003495 [Aphis glycines]